MCEFCWFLPTPPAPFFRWGQCLFFFFFQIFSPLRDKSPCEKARFNGVEVRCGPTGSLPHKSEQGDTCPRLPFLSEKKQQRGLEIVMMRDMGTRVHTPTNILTCSCWQRRWINTHRTWQEKDLINNSLWLEQLRDWFRIENKTLNQNNFSVWNLQMHWLPLSPE